MKYELGFIISGAKFTIVRGYQIKINGSSVNETILNYDKFVRFSYTN